MRTLFALVQLFLFKNTPGLYKVVYFLYKQFSDADKIKWMKQHITKGMTVLDVGANIGFYTTVLSEIVGDTGKIYAFEPDETNFSFLKKNTAHLKNVIIENIAVGDTNGTIRLYKNESLNVDHQTFDSGEARKFTEITCVSLDSYMAEKPVDFIKIDIQGFDYFAMKGASAILRNNLNLSIIGELWPFGLTKAGASATLYLEMLKEAGFTLEVDSKVAYSDVISDKNFYTDFIATKHGN